MSEYEYTFGRAKMVTTPHFSCLTMGVMRSRAQADGDPGSTLEGAAAAGTQSLPNSAHRGMRR